MPPGVRLRGATEPGAIEEAIAALRAGQIVGIPTETVYGIAVLPLAGPLGALMAAKGRAPDKGIVLLIDGLHQVAHLVEVPIIAKRLAGAWWPGALTLVLPLRPMALLPVEVTGGRDTLGLRLPDHPVPRALARALGPIAVTSANRSGEPDAQTAAELGAALGASLALVLDDGPVRGGVPSTVVSVDHAGHWVLLRAGAIGDPELRDSVR